MAELNSCFSVFVVLMIYNFGTIWVVEVSSGGYKIGKIFEINIQKETIEFRELD